MHTTQTEKKKYTYPITNIGLDDDVAIQVKQIAKSRRMPAYRLASDVLRNWLKRQAEKGGR